MPPSDETRKYTDALADDSDGVRAASHELRDVSRQILSEIAQLKKLERESRGLRMGSPEFREKSGQITEQAHRIFALASEQQALAEVVPPQAESLEDMDEDGEPSDAT